MTCSSSSVRMKRYRGLKARDNMQVMKRLDAIKVEFEKAVDACSDVSSMEDIRVAFLGRKCELTQILRNVSSLSAEEKPLVGKQANILKNEFARKLEELKERLERADASGKAEKIDVTLPGIKRRLGARHPLRSTLSRINDIFVSLGFAIAEGPEIETEFYNFEALNIPLDHPSRDAFDTFYVEGKHVLRSHTSNVQIHVMQKQPPPVQMIMPGRVYRPDAVDASHSFMFHQVEGLMVDRGVSFSDLKGVLSIFCRSMFG